MASAACVNSSADSLPFTFLSSSSSSAADDDFEFRLEDPVTLIPADQLFSDGKLQVTTTFKSPDVVLESKHDPQTTSLSQASDNANSTSTDSYLFSPKAPRCSSRWKEILGLKRHSQTAKTTSFKHFLNRSSRSSSSNSSCSCDNSNDSKNSNNSSSSLDQSLSLPLLKDNSKDVIDYYDTVSISISRLSLSSSSNHPFGNSDPNPFVLNRNPNMKLVKPKAENANGNGRVGRSPVRRAVGETTSRGASVDSPRLNSSGKIVFQSLERNSSSPSSFNGGPRYKHRGMERSYSANVRVTPVLNVPVCSLPKSVFGLSQLFSSSPQKRDGGSSKGQGISSRNRADRT